MMTWKARWTLLRTAGKQLVEDDAPMFAAALAYYTSLSLGPAPDIAPLDGDGPGHALAGAARRGSGRALGRAGGRGGAHGDRERARAALRSSGGGFAGIAGVLTLLLGATGVFAQLQLALNRTWDVVAKPGRGIRSWIRKRLLSLGMVLVIGFLLLVSLVLDTALAVLGTLAEGRARCS
jgi:membrane protein